MRKSLPAFLTRRRRLLILRLITIALLQAGIAGATAFLVRSIFDHLTAADEQTLRQGAVMVVLALAGAWLRMRERIEAEKLGQDYVHQLRLHLYRHLSRLSPRLLQKRAKGGILLRFIGDLTALRQWISLGIARLTVAAIVTFGALVALFWLDPPLATVVTLVLGSSAGLAFLFGSRLEQSSREARRRRARLATNLGEKTSSMAVVQAFGQIRRERRRVERQSMELQSAMLSRAKAIGRLRAISDGAGSLAGAAVLLLGAYEATGGKTSPGSVAAALAITALLTPYLRDLGRVHEYWLSAKVAREKIGQFLQLPVIVPERKRRLPLPPGRGHLRFEGVMLENALDHIDAEIQEGQVVALVGPNGGGKSTLLSLTARLIQPDEGRILLDGAELEQIKTVDLRRAIGIVSADLPLLRGSLRRNLCYRWPRAPEEEIERVIELCGLEEMLTELPRGDSFRLSEGGGNLSLGQRQRLMLARALLGSPRLLLLDEADANLDPCATRLIDRILMDYPGTILIVTHRVERLHHASQIWYLDDGRLLEKGPPEQLLTGGSHTQRLFQQRRAS